jgi:ADP-heptose:LPS heptosyltransferase
MSLFSPFLNFAAATLRLRAPRRPPPSGGPRILVIRRNRLGDMIYTLPLLHSLRRHLPGAHIAVACDPVGAPIAEACEAVNQVIVLAGGWNRWQAAYKNAAALQHYDFVIAAKGGFDRRLAVLTRLTNASTRIGFENITGGVSAYYTNPIPLPPRMNDEHQVETILRLLAPLGIARPKTFRVNLNLRVPDASREWAAEILSSPPFSEARSFMLVNFSSTVGLKFREEDFIALIRRVLGATNLAVGLVAAPVDQQLTHEIAMCMASKRVVSVDTPGPMDLAAMLEKAFLLFTPEGGAAHLAAAMRAPAVILWSEGPFKKWRSLGPRHAYVLAEPGEKFIPLDRVWQTLQPLLNPSGHDLTKVLDDVFEIPHPPELGS